jgi:tetratricopeptide (TPR) repeat protein
LLDLVRVECALEKFDSAVSTSRRLIECAAENPAYWVLRARVLASHAETLTNAGHQEQQLKAALKHVRKAKELGDHSASTQVLESDLLLATGRQLAASKLLKDRLKEAAELKSDELEMALALLRQHASRSHGRGFQEAIDALAQALPEAEDRRRTVAHALCRLAADLLPVRPASGIKCVDLAEVCSPGDPTVLRMVQACAEHKDRLEQRAETIAVAAASEVGERLERANRDDGWWSWSGPHWIRWVIVILLSKSMVLGLWNCGRDPPLPAGNVVLDEDGNVTHVIDAGGKQVPIEVMEAKLKGQGKKSLRKKKPPQVK